MVSSLEHGRTPSQLEWDCAAAVELVRRFYSNLSSGASQQPPAAARAASDTSVDDAVAAVTAHSAAVAAAAARPQPPSLPPTTVPAAVPGSMEPVEEPRQPEPGFIDSLFARVEALEGRVSPSIRAKVRRCRLTSG